ncbi:MAG: PadR family transcriptional regulator [Deltaproteobacteria bacterium]
MSMKLIVLGVLMEGEKHPYEIQQIVKEREMDRYIKFQKGSLYYAVEQLEKKGLIEVASTVRDGKRPDRTVYRITDRGRAEFQNLLVEQYLRTDYFYDPIYAAMAFTCHANQEDIVRALAQRVQDQETRVQVLQRVYENHIADNISRVNLYILFAALEQSKTQLKWLKMLYQDALDGRLGEVGRPIGYE